MAIQYVGGQIASVIASTATATTITFSLSGGLAGVPAPGDLVFVAYGVGSSVDRVIGVNTAGYTEITELTASDTYDVNLSVSWKIMDFTADTTVVVSATGATADGGAVLIHVFRGVDPDTPLDVTSTTATGSNSGIPNPPAITPTSANTTLVVFGATASTGGVGDMIAAYLTNMLTAFRYTDANDINVGGGWRSGPAAGVAYDPAAFTVTGSGNTQSWAAVTIALRELVPQTYGKWDFESGTTAGISSAFTGTSVVTGQGQVGTYCGATIIGAADPNGFGFRPSRRFRTNALYSKFNFKVDLTANPTSEQQLSMPIFRNSAAQGIVDMRAVISSGGVMTLLVAEFVNVATLYFGTTITDNTWYTIEFSVIRNGAGASSVSLSVNGTNVYSSSTLSLGTGELWYPEFSSLMGATGGTAGTVYYDDIILSTSPIVAATGRPKVWSGSAWVQKPLKVWNGTAWVEKPVKYWNGSAWVTVT